MSYATGNRLKKIADRLYGGNHSELARKLEMKPQALAKYTKGESMPGGLILIRLYNIGVNINWFLTGEGAMLREPDLAGVAEPVQEYLSRLDQGDLNEQEKKTLEELMQFSETIRQMDISEGLQRALLLVFARHVGKAEPGQGE